MKAAWNTGKDLGVIGAANTFTTQPVSGQGDEWRWLHISPYGEFPNSAGLQVFGKPQADAMVADFNSAAAKLDRFFAGLPLYIGHPDAEPELYKDDAAYGWMHELDARNDGLWARTRLTPQGAALLTDRRYKFVSAYWLMRAANGRPRAFHPLVLKSVGLTNNPNIRGGHPVAANSQGINTNNNTHMTEEQMKALRKALGLAETATEAEIITAANAAREEAGKLAAANTAKADAETKLATATTKANTLETQLTAANTATVKAEAKFTSERNARIAEQLTSAVNSGRITEAQRADYAGKLAQDFDKESAALAALKPALNTTSKTKALGARTAESGADNVAAINTAVTKHMKDNGTDYHTSYMAVKRDPQNKQLFAAKNDDGDNE